MQPEACGCCRGRALRATVPPTRDSHALRAGPAGGIAHPLADVYRIPSRDMEPDIERREVPGLLPAA